MEKKKKTHRQVDPEFILAVQITSPFALDRLQQGLNKRPEVWAKAHKERPKTRQKL